MTTNIRTLIRVACTAALLTGGLLTAERVDAASLRVEPNGSIRFYDDNGYDRGYSWCRSGGGATRCDYYTFEQCRVSGTPNYICVPNPWSHYVNVPAQKLRLQ